MTSRCQRRESRAAHTGGGGVEFRLGSAFTLGLAGAWNWSTGFADDLCYRLDPSGGEFTVTMGWQFGR